MLAVEMLDVLFGDAVKFRFELHESTVKLPLVSWSATLYQRVSEEGIVGLYFLHPTTQTHTHTLAPPLFPQLCLISLLILFITRLTTLFIKGPCSISRRATGGVEEPLLVLSVPQSSFL